MKVVKLTESDLTRIVERVLSEQLQVTDNVQPTTSAQTDGVPNIFQSPTANRPGDAKLIDSLLKQRGGERNSQGKIVFPCLKKLNSMKVAGSTAEFDVAGTIYTFYQSGNYTREDSNGKTRGTWKCDAQGFVELDGKQKLTGKTPFQWKQAPTAEEVQSGKKLLRYGMMGDFVEVVQEKLKSLGSNPGTIDKKFGGNTLRAVKDFQKKSGLKDDGLVGKDTYAVLFREKQEPIDTSKLQTKQLKSVAPQQKSPITRQTEPVAQTNVTVADTGLDFS